MNWKFWQRKPKAKPDMVMTMTVANNRVKLKWSIKEDDAAIAKSVVTLIGAIRSENLLNRILYTCYRTLEKKGYEHVTKQALMQAFGFPVENQPLISPLEFMGQFREDE